MTSDIRHWRDRPWGSPWGKKPATIEAVSAITEIGLRRGMCYGPCPAYELSLLRTGEARFTGEHFVDLMGDHVAAIAPADFEMLALAMVHLGFDEFAPNYEVNFTDAETTWAWLVRDGSRTEVEDYGGAGPRRLRLITELVDEAASTLDWRRDGGGDVDRGDVPIFVGLHVDDSWRPASIPSERVHWTQAGRKA